MTSQLAHPTIVWTQGGEAEVTVCQGVHVTVHSTKPYPPGAPVPGTLSHTGAHPFTLKVAGAKKIAEGVWEIRGRLVTATTPVLAAFADLVSPRE